jgi:hypothetical protein
MRVRGPLDPDAPHFTNYVFWTSITVHAPDGELFWQSAAPAAAQVGESAAGAPGPRTLRVCVNICHYG